MTTPKRPRDTNQLAKAIVDIVASEQEGTPIPKSPRRQSPAKKQAPALERVKAKRD